MHTPCVYMHTKFAMCNDSHTFVLDEAMGLEEKMSKWRAELASAPVAERESILTRVKKEMSPSKLQSAWGKLQTVTKQGGKNMSIHQNLERPHFLMKMLEAYRTTEVADMAEDRKDDEIRNFLMRRNNLMLQACHTHTNTHSHTNTHLAS